jgi:asparagine synthase (glutamine-hydrolysing)
MCGIVGIIHRDADRAVEEDLLLAMTDVLIHRGPDDSGTWICGPVGLGHRRLSVIDLAGGHQPMSVADGSMVITYNGEIYNYLELREELKRKDFEFRTLSDTEVLLQMYAAHGEGCVGLLNGMFSFAVWDASRKRLFAARDRLGIKPFYFYEGEGIFLFASEIKSLLLHPAVVADLDHDALQDYLNLQYCLGDKTLFKGIHRLLPGHRLVWEAGTVRTEQYWDLDFTPQEIGEEEVVERLRWLLADAVRLRLRSDVPLGTHLSGGLDSSTIAALAADLMDSKLSVFTGGFRNGNRYDESHYARLVADNIGASYFEVFPTAQDLADTFEDLIYYLDEPIAGAAVFPQYFLSRLASEHVKVVLGGQGADEIFCGYARYLVAHLERSLKGAIYGDVNAPDLVGLAPNLQYLQGYEPTMERLFSRDLFGPDADRYYRLLQRSQDMEGIVMAGNGDRSYSTREAFRGEYERPETDSSLDRMLYVDVKNHLQSLLQLEDRTSMAVSLETRLPLLDHRIVELACGVPASARFGDGQPKYLFRKAIASTVPREILERKDKMGFPVPIYEWFSGDLRPFVQDILLGDTIRSRGFFDMAGVERAVAAERPFGRTVWGLLSLELWFRRFFDKR